MRWPWGSSSTCCATAASADASGVYVETVRNHRPKDPEFAARCGATAFAYSAEKPAMLRGPQRHFGWCDELAKWPAGAGGGRDRAARDNLIRGLRLGEAARTIVTRAPRQPSRRCRIVAQMVSGGAFRSFFMGGFECSSHRRPDGARLDLVRSTAHANLALNDYRACAHLGLRTVRDGLRWHLIETAPGRYDWSSWLPMVEAAAEAGVEVVWDLFHYGSPDHLDQGSEDLVHSFAAFAAEAARVHRQATGAPPRVTPVNEISFFTWAVRTGYFPRAGPDEPGWFKRHLVRAAIAAVRAMRQVEPGCRFFCAEPLIHIASRARLGEETGAAEQARLGQYEAIDMLLGRSAPELGGGPDVADAIGLNFYPDNQWYHGGSTVPLGHHDYRPLSEMLTEAAQRWGKPLFLAETGAEGSARPAWLHYVCGEVREAMRRGVGMEGICLYPVTAYPGWDDYRHAHCGLFTTPHSDGERRVYEPLAEELARQRALFGL